MGLQESVKEERTRNLNPIQSLFPATQAELAIDALLRNPESHELKEYVTNLKKNNPELLKSEDTGVIVANFLKAKFAEKDSQSGGTESEILTRRRVYEKKLHSLIDEFPEMFISRAVDQVMRTTKNVSHFYRDRRGELISQDTFGRLQKKN